jgi:histidine triad (HIT) family protein
MSSATNAGCIFCDIVTGNAPASVVHRDDRCMAFMDIKPVTPGHLLVIPIAHASYLAELEPAMGGHLFSVAEGLAAGIRRSGLRADGINFFLADGEAAGQEVFHVHLHVFPRFDTDGFGLRFAPGYGQPVPRERLDREAAAISKATET